MMDKGEKLTYEVMAYLSENGYGDYTLGQFEDLSKRALERPDSITFYEAGLFHCIECYFMKKNLDDLNEKIFRIFK
jgi:hypothetical protein